MVHTTDVDEVVISGMGAYFPKSRNLEEFKTNLLSKESLLESRWKEGERDVSNKLGVIPDIQFFDPAFFGIHRQQSTFMDPMQRLMLERTFEALADAGLNPAEIRGKRVGVYMGSSVGENDNLFYESIVSGFGVTGHSRAMLANRISYYLNLKGPSCAYDSNWINGIEVLQMGYDAVRYGHCEAAIVGTVNLALNAELSWLYNDMGLLSADGSTKAFDVAASGYARSDGVIALVIQRASEAKRCYATIMGTATVFNGFRDGTLLDVDQPSMINFLNDFYKKCKVGPEAVDFVECYGAALKHLDEAELNALDAVYCKNRKKPLMIGSVKTNTGHAEASANFVSLAKVLIAFETGKIPATLQYEKPNPNISALVDGRMEVVTDNKEWDGQYAAINGIGLSSSYAHCVLKKNVKRKQLEAVDDVPRLVVASTRTEEGIQEILNTIKGQPVFDPEYLALIQEFFSKTISGHLYKAYSILDKNGEIARESDYFPGNKRQIWFIYSGMGSQWAGMGKDLMGLPMFAESIMKCHNRLKPLGVDLLQIITADDPTLFDNILNSFVGIAAIQIALTDILKAMGVVPDGVIGHSVGELGCSYADDCLTAEQMIMCSYSRGKASLEAELIPGMMAAVGMGYHQIKSQLPESIEVACRNSATSCTISGPTADMEKYVKELTDKGVFARLVNVANIAYHSRYIKPAAPNLLKYLEKVIPSPKERSAKWISTSAPEAKWDTEDAKLCSAQYHTNNLLGSVLFEEGSKHIPKDAICIEIAPHGLLQAILKKSLKSGCTNIALTQRGSKNGLNTLLTAIGKMYLAGVDVNIAKIYPKIEYPVGYGTVGLAPLVHWEHGETWRTGLEDKLNYLVSVKDIQISIADENFRHCVGHQIDEKIILPISSYMTIIMNILGTSRSIDITEAVFENMRFRKVLTIPKVSSIPFYGMVQRGTGEFEILSNEEIIVTGRISIPQPTDEFFVKTYEIEACEGDVELSANDIYGEFAHRGHKYTANYRQIKSLKIAKEGTIATIAGNLKWQDYVEAMFQQNYLLQGEKYQNITVPMVIPRINLAVSKLPKTDKDIQIKLDYSTGVIDMEGIQLCNLTTTTFPATPKQVSYDSLDMIPAENCVCDNLESAISYSVNFAINNYSDPLTKSITIYDIAKNNQSLIENIKNVTDKYVQLSSNINTVNDSKIMIVYQSEPILIVSDDEIHDDTVNSITQSEALALVKTSPKLSSNKTLVTIVKFIINNVSYSLVKKADNKVAKVVKVKGDTLTAKDILKGSLSWVSELKTTLQSLKPNESLFMTSTILPTEGIVHFIKEIRSNKALDQIKYLFVLDKKLPDVNPNDEYYRNILNKNIYVTVIKNGVAGTLSNVPIDFKKNVSNDIQMTSSSLGDGKLECIGINMNDETLKAKNVGLGNIDYCTVKNQAVTMGLAYLDKATCNLVPDNILKWKVPDSWSAEDGCTIPHAYATAYHCLFQKGKLEAGENVLIHGACSAIGLAAISIATNMGCSVYVTVATDYQRAFLKKQFSAMQDRNIFSSENTTFELQLLGATGGVGAHVIINCVTDSNFHATVRCLASYGRLLQLGKIDSTRNNVMGMSVFLKNTCIVGIVPENIFDAREEIKTQLRDMVQKGIDKHVVRPLNRKVVNHQDVSSILDNLQQVGNIGKILIKLNENLALNQLNVDKHNQFICDTKSSHLIYAGVADIWVDLLEWLVFRGARKVLIVSDSKPQSVCISRRIQLLKDNFGADITYMPNKIQTKENAAELIAQLYSMGPIQCVFTLPNGKEAAVKQSDIKPVQYLETALRTSAPKALFINFLTAVAGTCQPRIDAGLPTYNLCWDEDVLLTDIIASLDDILSYRIDNIYIKNDKLHDINQDSVQALYKKLALMLPSDVKELLEMADDAPDDLELVQLPSSGPRKIRELPPIILVPGLAGHETLKEFALELLYPIFCTFLPNRYIDLKEAAKIFAQKIRELYRRGPYNIVSVSLGSPLALEIAKILQGYANTQVTLIDAAPDTLQAALKMLGEGSTGEIELINRVLKINDTAFLKGLSSLPSWSARVAAALETIQESAENKALLKQSLELFKKNLQNVIDYRPDDVIIEGRCHFIRPVGSSKYDYCGLKKYFKQEPTVDISNGDHHTILKSEETLDIVNENVTVK